MMDFACVPACKRCRDADGCDKPVITVSATMQMSLQDSRGLAMRGPNLHPYPSELILLPCGCRDVPWPLFHVLGESFDSIYCEAHGWQKLTKKYLKDGIRTARRMNAQSADARNAQASLFDDEPPY